MVDLGHTKTEIHSMKMFDVRVTFILFLHVDNISFYLENIRKSLWISCIFADLSLMDFEKEKKSVI